MEPIDEAIVRHYESIREEDRICAAYTTTKATIFIYQQPSGSRPPQSLGGFRLRQAAALRAI